MKLVVIMKDTHRTRMALIHENEWMPHGRRHVEIELTPDQQMLLAPKVVGMEGGQKVFEEIGECWIDQN